MCCWAVARGQPGVEALGPPATPGCLSWPTGLGSAWPGYSWVQPHALVGAARSTSPAWPSKSRRSGPGCAPTVKWTQRADSSTASNADQPRFPEAARPAPAQSILVDARERQDLSPVQGGGRRVKRGSRAGAPALAAPASNARRAGARDGQASAICLKGVEPQAPSRTWLARWRRRGSCLLGKMMPLLCSRPTGSPKVPKRPWPHRAWSRCPPFPDRPCGLCHVALPSPARAGRDCSGQVGGPTPSGQASRPPAAPPSICFSSTLGSCGHRAKPRRPQGVGRVPSSPQAPGRPLTSQASTALAATWGAGAVFAPGAPSLEEEGLRPGVVMHRCAGDGPTSGTSRR